MPPNPTELVDLKNGEETERMEKLIEDSNVPYIEVKTMRATIPQVVASWAQSWLLLELGMMINIPLIVLGALHRNTNPGEISLNDSEASWFGGILLILEPVGGLMSAGLQDVLGRKICMVLVNIPQFAGWLLLYFASSTHEIFLAAFCLGFSIGFMEAPVLSYVGEICQPRLRGTLASFTSLHVTLGLLVMNVLGHFAHWRTAALVSSALPIISSIAIMLVPESPIWLLMKGRKTKALQALQWLRGWVDPEVVMPEFRSLEKHIAEAASTQHGEDDSFSQRLVSKIKFVMRPEMLEPFKLILLFFFFVHCAGLSCTRPYLVGVTKQLGITMDSYLVLMIGGCMHMLGCLICTGLMRVVGKRRLTMFSMAACVAVTLSLGAYSYAYQILQNIDVPAIPVALLLALNFFTSLGVFIVPWALLAEIFPSRGRGLGGGVSSAMYYIMFFAVTKTFLDLEHLMGLHGVIFMYGIVGAVGMVYLYHNLPETEGKRLEEVEEYFRRKGTKKEG